jgi:hypothetical protein
MSLNIPRRTCADLYGPTVGDRVARVIIAGLFRGGNPRRVPVKAR